MIQALAQTASCPPSLATLLRFATRRPGLDGDDHAWRCHFFGVARQQDDPVAPFASLALGLDPAACYWLCATPVNLQLQRDSFVLAEGQMRGLSLM